MPHRVLTLRKTAVVQLPTALEGGPTDKFHLRLSTSWRPTEDVGSDTRERPGTSLESEADLERPGLQPLKLAQDRRAWGATIHDVVNSIGDNGSPHTE